MIFFYFLAILVNTEVVILVKTDETPITRESPKLKIGIDQEFALCHQLRSAGRQHFLTYFRKNKSVNSMTVDTRDKHMSSKRHCVLESFFTPSEQVS